MCDRHTAPLSTRIYTPIAFSTPPHNGRAERAVIHTYWACFLFFSPCDFYFFGGNVAVCMRNMGTIGGCVRKFLMLHHLSTATNRHHCDTIFKHKFRSERCVEQSAFIHRPMIIIILSCIIHTLIHYKFMSKPGTHSVLSFNERQGKTEAFHAAQCSMLIHYH